MTPDQERWAEALAIERMYGAMAPLYIEERIASLSLEGMRLAQLARGERQ